MTTNTPPVLTPMRSPMPPRRAPPPGVGGARGAGGAANTAAAVAGSSSEKETPTVVFTENSPHSNVRGGSGIAFDFRSTMAGGGRRLVVSSSARPEKLFQSQDDDDSDDDCSSDPTSGGGGGGGDDDDDDDDGSRASDSKSTRCDGDGDDDDVSSDDSEGARHLQVVSMIQNVLDYGIASVCRLRGLFPPSFFQKMEVHDDTSVTRFNEGAIRRMCTGEGEGEDEGEDEEGYHRSDDESSDDGASSGGMVKSFRERTQKSLSPLTELSQRCNDGKGGRRRDRDRDRDRAANGDEQDKRMAMEALLILRWMRRGGVNEILRDGNLARLVFGICVPSEGSSSSGGGANNDELVESYSVR